jgi:hypothetical protein
VPRSKSLDDAFYDEQVERLSGLDKYPLVPTGQKELRQTLRRISETDRRFIERVISEVVDTRTVCPKPSEIMQYAARLRQPSRKSLGNPDCEVCHGSGWESFVKRVNAAGGHEYDADFARPCRCRAGVL